MQLLREGNLELYLPDDVQAKKFDDSTHGLSHCMKAVDFIVETSDKIVFIEFKDLDNPHAPLKERKDFLEKLMGDKKDDHFVRKYRDTFIYQWAARALTKPIEYYVLVATSQLDAAMLLARTEELKRKLPLEGPKSGVWQRQIAAGCGVFNIETWNEHLGKWKVSRVSKENIDEKDRDET